MKCAPILLLSLLFLGKYAHSLPDYDTIIVGGGLSGLSAARGLKKAGEEFLLIEARDRLGGRAYSIGEPPLEAGPEWVDEDHTAIRQLSQELGVKLKKEVKVRKSILIKRNRVMSPEDFALPFKKALEKLAALPTPYEEGLEGAVDESFLGFLDRKGITLTQEEQDAINYILKDDPGVDLEGVSYAALTYIRAELEDYFEESDGEDEEYIFPQGTRSLIEAMAIDIGQDRIRLSSPLQRLSRDGGGVYHLKLEDSELTANQVILSLPFSVLRSEYGILDDASLEIPQDFRYVMDTMPYGSVASILIPYTNPPSLEYDNLDQQVKAWTRPGGVRLWMGGERVKGLTTECPELKAILAKTHDKLRHDGVQIEGKPYYFVNWATDPYARGSYNAYWLTQATLRVSDFNAGMHCFASPLNDNTLFFIGEHTMLNSAYMESAVQSGQIVADFLSK